MKLQIYRLYNIALLREDHTNYTQRRHTCTQSTKTGMFNHAPRAESSSSSRLEIGSLFKESCFQTSSLMPPLDRKPKSRLVQRKNLPTTKSSSSSLIPRLSVTMFSKVKTPKTMFTSCHHPAQYRLCHTRSIHRNERVPYTSRL